MTTLKEFLNHIEFDYKIENNKLSLIDCTGANLANIESEQFEVDENLINILTDRLDNYINDYFISDMVEQLNINNENDIYPYDEKLIKILKTSNKYTDEFIEFFEDIITGNLKI